MTRPPRSLRQIAEEYERRRLLREGKQAQGKSKYKNTYVKVAGQSYASKLEQAVHQEILLRERAGEIVIEKVQDVVRIEIPPGSGNRWGCRPDFRCRYVETGQVFWAEAKGAEGDRYKATKFIWRAGGPGPMEVYKGSHLRPVLTEVIVPLPSDTSERSSSEE